MASKNASTVNYWPDSRCAKTFWGQQDLPAYQELLFDTIDWLDPKPGERWVDLGCGGGRLVQAIWEKSSGKVAEIVGLDCAAANERAFQKLRARLHPSASPRHIRFVTCDFSNGLASWEGGQFDGAVSGMAIQYAESYSEEKRAWTADAYDRVLAETYRLLRPGGRFIFSVNVPNPKWSRVALASVFGVLRADRRIRYIKRAWQMWLYGRWLKREARRGRFHYLPIGTIVDKLHALGFTAVEHRLSYARQAFLVRCQKEALALRMAV